MTIKEIIDAERPDEFCSDWLSASDVDIMLDRIEEAVLEDEAALMKQLKLWASDFKAAEQRIAELEEALKIATHWLDDEVPPYVIRQLKEVLPGGDA